MEKEKTNNMSVIILGIESSCDDTSAAVIKDGVMLSNVIASQKVHEAYGGVVPELASRAHQQNIVPVVSEAIRQAGITKEDIENGVEPVTVRVQALADFSVNLRAVLWVESFNQRGSYLSDLQLRKVL